MSGTWIPFLASVPEGEAPEDVANALKDWMDEREDRTWAWIDSRMMISTRQGAFEFDCDYPEEGRQEATAKPFDEVLKRYSNVNADTKPLDALKERFDRLMAAHERNQTWAIRDALCDMIVTNNRLEGELQHGVWWAHWTDMEYWWGGDSPAYIADEFYDFEGKEEPIIVWLLLKL